MNSESQRINIFLNKSEKLIFLCRICLTENTERSQSLFEVQDSMSISEKVTLCTGVQMHVNDGLPDIICEHCNEALEAANSFRVKCEYSDSLLKKFYINGVLSEAIAENIEPPKEMLGLVKQEVFGPCEPWIKFEDEGDTGCDDLHHFSCDDSSSEVANARLKTSRKGKLKTRKVGPPIIKVESCSSKSEIKKNNVGDRDESAMRYNCDEKVLDLNMAKEKGGRLKLYSCSICKKSLSSQTSLERHTMCVHSEEKNQRRHNITGYGVNKRFHCTECSYSTPRRQTLDYHSRTHTGEKPYQCEVCNARFSQPGSLIGHARLHSDKMYYTCPECGKQFKLKQRYERHKLVHSNIKKYICTMCNKGLKTKKSLEKHTNRHLNIRNYSCDTCGATFVALEDLINHARKHTALKKFECHICQFRTRLKPTLQKHMMRHTGEKKFKCDLCQFTAYDRGTLTRHSRKHTREKRYSCPVCEMKMIHSTSVNRHMLRAHGIKYTLNDHADRRIIK